MQKSSIRTQKRSLIIIGAGGFAREVYWHAQQTREFDSEWRVKGFLDGDIKLSEDDYRKLPDNIPLLGDIDSYQICPDDVFTCAVGTPEARRKLIGRMLSRGADFVSIINQRSSILPTAEIGRGVIIGLDNGIGDHVRVGDFSVINNATYLGHDVTTGQYACIMSHVDIGGYAQIGDNVFIGSHVSIIPKSKIGDNAYIGTGSVVLKRVNEGAKVFGNPAIEIKQRQ